MIRSITGGVKESAANMSGKKYCWYLHSTPFRLRCNSYLLADDFLESLASRTMDSVTLFVCGRRADKVHQVV
ncbi:uncharacterized protein METZ01_LOCUS76949 [marine metagenome]|uniref:Uncharacterized protein n=1 Tax=marine metagenome TaxID=408172 RepID=A0A381U771_9ZZZZ